MKKFLNEFKEFAMRGNVIDLAVGVIIGGAFGKIVSSLVNDIIMPFMGILIGGINLRDLTFNIGNVSLQYGLFLQNIVDFVIISFTIFVAIKLLGKFERKKLEEKESESPKKAEEIILLEEIRDSLKSITKES